MLISRLGRAATGDAEIIIQRIAVEAAHPLGQIAQREAHVQHLIVKSEVADGHQIQGRLILPVALAQFGSQRFQFVAGRLPFPVGFEGELQFAFGSDARKTKIVSVDHEVSFS